MKLINCLFVGAMFALPGCAYESKPITTGAVSIVAAYTEKIPGKFALIIEPGELNKVIRPRGVACSAHSYPLNLTDSFRSSVRATLQNLVERLEEVQAPLPSDALRAQGYKGQILVRGESLEGKLIAVPGFWTANISTTVHMSASVVADGQSGRLVGKTVEGIAERESEAGALCSGGAASVEEASTQAMRKLMVQLGEALANSERLRRSAVAQATR